MISVIIPTYNRKTLLHKCVSNALSQTIKDIEVIIVDDCSDDGTFEFFSNYPDTRVRCIRLSERSGACAARNTGIKNAKGEYIAFQDSDDSWYPNKLEKQLNYLKEVNADIVFCDMERFIDGVKAEPYTTRIQKGKINYEDLIPSNLISTQTIFGKTACFKKTQFNPQMKRVQDWELAFRLVQKYNVYFLNEILVSAYIQSDSISKNNAVAFESGLYIYENYIKNHINLRPDLAIYLMRVGYEYVVAEQEIMRVGYEYVVAELEKTKRSLDTIQNSKIWKITYPYRRFMDKVRAK